MFKKLRNKFLMVNSVIIAMLLISCFGIGYLVVYNRVSDTIEQSLVREIERRSPRFDMGENIRPPKNIREGEVREPVSNPTFSLTFSIETDTDGNILYRNTGFFAFEDFYSDKLQEIIKSGKNTGKIHYVDSDGSSSSWKYLIVENDTGYKIAFAEITTERRILGQLAFILLLIAVAAMIITVFISLFFANRSIKPIEEAYNKQKQFIADASHELKTPLTTINTNIDVLLSKGVLDNSEDRKWLTYIKEEIKRMTSLTNSLLYLARTDSNSNEILIEVSFSKVLKNVLMMMEVRAFEKGIELVNTIDDGISVFASEEKLKQLIIVLLDNAIKYTDKCGRIDVSLNRKGNDAILNIKNTGEGIEKKDLEHIFDRFYRADKARTGTDTSGYGLGLSIAKAITESFKGTIYAMSKENEYTEFIVKIPQIR